MKYVSELYGKHPGSDIYVLGTSPSARVFPTGFLEGKIVVGCNQAWKLAKVTYCLTIHPDLNIPEFIDGETPRPEIRWITGEEKCRGLSSTQFQYAEKQFYFFKYRGKPNTQPEHEPSDSGRVLEWVEKPTGDWLYLWSSIAQSAVNLAANLGAKNIILVGCDNSSLLGNHHAHGQHTRWKGVSPDHRYQQYYEGMAEVRSVLRRRGINVLAMNPFLKVDSPEMEFQRLCTELGVEERIGGQDMKVSKSRLESLLNAVRTRLKRRVSGLLRR